MWRSVLKILAVVSVPAMASADVSRTILSFSDLNGWASDDHQAALHTFRNTCKDLRDPTWGSLCAVASENPNARLFFETFFQPVLIEDDEVGLFTGYFEPELRGSLVQTPRYNTPLYALPEEVEAGKLWLSRKEIETTDTIKGRGLEIAWVDDPVAAFFLQIQGSGRVRLTNGQVIRLGYAGANGYPYRSIGKEMIQRGILQEHEVSAAQISKWVEENPEKGRELLWHNGSYVFFRRVDHVPPEKGPLGAMNRSISTLRSIAVDPKFTTLGAPVWIEKGGQNPMNRLMIAQDTGSAIKGAQRADIFFGTGDEAGRLAGQIKDPGRLVVLMPTRLAFALVGEE